MPTEHGTSGVSGHRGLAPATLGGMSDTSTDLPDLSQLPTQPPPPPPPPEAFERHRPKPRRPRRSGGRLWRVVALILAVQAALVTSAVLTAVERPSAAVAVVAVILTDAFMVVAFTIMLGMMGRR